MPFLETAEPRVDVRIAIQYQNRVAIQLFDGLPKRARRPHRPLFTHNDNRWFEPLLELLRQMPRTYHDARNIGFGHLVQQVGNERCLPHRRQRFRSFPEHRTQPSPESTCKDCRNDLHRWRASLHDACHQLMRLF